MLRALAVRDFILVDRVELEFAPGFSVLTGETGAGKSILLDALTLVLGDRAEAGVVRPGSDKAEIAATFDVAAHPNLRALLAANDLTDGDETECLLRRVLDSQGRSRAYVNGRPATLVQLREIGEALVDLHGQHAHQSLLRPETQRQLLDDYGGLSALAREVALAWRTWRELLARQEEAARTRAELAAERELLAERVAELAALKLGADEWRELVLAQTRLAHARGLIEAAARAVQALSEDEHSCEAQLRSVLAKLAAMQEYDPALGETVSLLESSQIQLQEALHALVQYQQRLELDPAELQTVEARLSAIHDVARKYRTRAQELPALLATTQARLAELAVTLNVEALTREEAAAHAKFIALTNELRAGREHAATELSRKVTDTMQSLALAGGAFAIALRALPEPASYGAEQIEFLVSAHADLPARPLAKVASGGELSRLSLAIQVVTSEVAQVPTLIFDEVDVGIGGGVAEIVGCLLRKLGSTRQVLVVTHLPQVAACAQGHFVVSKTESNGTGVKTAVQALREQERVEEIARMLGGVRITEKTRAHAKELLAGSGSGKN